MIEAIRCPSAIAKIFDNIFGSISSNVEEEELIMNHSFSPSMVASLFSGIFYGTH